MRMNGSEYMYTIAELGVGLSGFAALVIAIRRRDESSLRPIRGDPAALEPRP